jgi:hypothetical protein
MRNPKFIITVALGILGGWLVATSGNALLDQYFDLSNWTKLLIGLGLAWLGLIKLR